MLAGHFEYSPRDSYELPNWEVKAGIFLRARSRGDFNHGGTSKSPAIWLLACLRLLIQEIATRGPFMAALNAPSHSWHDGKNAVWISLPLSTMSSIRAATLIE